MNKYLFLEAMEKAGFQNQRMLAEEMGISFKILNNHLNGVTKVGTEDAIKYCEALQLTDEKKIIQIFLS